MAGTRSLAVLLGLLLIDSTVAFGCSPDRTPEKRPAAAIPVLLLTEADDGASRVAEAGDRVEIRLDEPAGDGERWRLASASGPARLESDAALRAERVFRFATAGAGRSEIVLARGSRSLRFVVETK